MRWRRASHVESRSELGQHGETFEHMKVVVPKLAHMNFGKSVEKVYVTVAVLLDGRRVDCAFEQRKQVAALALDGRANV